jgi:hypothetical protein
MHQKSSVWYGEFKPSIVCIAPHRFSVIDAFLEDCIFFVAQYDDFEIVEFQCFQVEEFPESVGIEKISQFNQLHSDKKMNKLLNWLKIDNPTYLSLKSKSEIAWSLIYFDNQFWFEIDDNDLQRVARTCKLIFQSMKLPAEIIYEFLINHQLQELEVADFFGIRESTVRNKLADLSSLKIEQYGSRHMPMDPITLSHDESFISKEKFEKRVGCLQLLVQPFHQLHGDTVLVFVNPDNNTTSPNLDQLSFAAPYFIESKEAWITELMNAYDCRSDLILVELPKLIDIKLLFMTLPCGFDGFEPQERIDASLEILQRALNMCASYDQPRVHLLDPTLDLMIYEGDFGPEMVHLVLEHTSTNRSQWVFWHCRDVESFRHYFELRKSVMLKSDPWDTTFKPTYDGNPF